jgi:hypothetical protein
LVGFVGGRLKFYCEMSLHRPGSGAHIQIAIDLIELVFATGLGLILAKRFGARFGRWFGFVQPPEARSPSNYHPSLAGSR